MSEKDPTRQWVKNLLGAFSGQQSVLTIPRPYLQLTGSLEAALLLSQIVFWSDRTKDAEGWFAKTYAEWTEELTLTKYQVMRAMKILVTLGIKTMVKKFGNSPTVHYRIDREEFELSIVKFFDEPKLKSLTNQESEKTSRTYTKPTTETTDTEKRLAPSGASEPSQSNPEPTVTHAPGTSQDVSQPNPLPETLATGQPETPRVPDTPIPHSAPPLSPETSVVNFHDVKDHWNVDTQTWDDERYVYIGRGNLHHRLPQSKWANPFTLEKEADRENAVRQYRHWIAQQPRLAFLEELRGKTLVCWCHPRACHGHVLIDLLNAAQDKPLPQENSPAGENPVEDNKAIGALIKAWLDATGTIVRNPYANKTNRDLALQMHQKGVTPDDIQRFVSDRRADPFWADKSIKFSTIAADIVTWKTQSVAPEHVPFTHDPTVEYTHREEIKIQTRHLAQLLRPTALLEKEPPHE